MFENKKKLKVSVHGKPKFADTSHERLRVNERTPAQGEIQNHEEIFYILQIFLGDVTGRMAKDDITLAAEKFGKVAAVHVSLRKLGHAEGHVVSAAHATQ